MNKSKLIRGVLSFLAAVVVFTPLAVWRAGDLRHTVVTVTERGGRVRHGAQLEFGRDRYTVLVTGRNRLKETADLRVAVEGEPAIPFEVHSNYPPTIDLDVHEWPEFEDGTLRHCHPGEKLGLWVVLKPEKAVLAEGEILAPVEYAITLRDGDERAVLSVPVEFRDPRDSRDEAQAGGGH